MIKKFWTYRRNFLISFVLIGIIVLPEAKYFHEWALAGIVGALLVSIVGAVKAESTIEKKTAFFFDISDMHYCFLVPGVE